MSKIDIAGMLGNKAEPEQPVVAPEIAPIETKSSRGSSKKRSAPSKSSSAAKPSELPKWQQCEPQTIHMWPEHLDDLKALARTLQRSKEAGVGERITMATLVRVATAHLLAQQEMLSGTTEAELLDSLER